MAKLCRTILRIGLTAQLRDKLHGNCLQSMDVQAQAVLAHIVEVVRMAAAATIGIALAELLLAAQVHSKTQQCENPMIDSKKLPRNNALAGDMEARELLHSVSPLSSGSGGS